MKEQYDERQLQWRQKIALQTLLLTLLLIFVNGVAKTFYLWAEPMTETVVLLCVPKMCIRDSIKAVCVFGKPITNLFCKGVRHR